MFDSACYTVHVDKQEQNLKTTQKMQKNGEM